MQKFKLNFTGYEDVPEHTQGALARYVEDRLEPGSFLQAVLTNDLFRAVSQADQWNQQRLPAIVRFIYNRCPMGCYGSQEAYEAWLQGE